MSQHIALVALGGALGAVLRFLISNAMAAAFGRAFPYGTLLVNVIGSCLIGLLYVLISERMLAGPGTRALLVVGFLGALTTFSTFSIETLNLLESGAPARALANVAVNVVLCLLACWGGMLAMRHW